MKRIALAILLLVSLSSCVGIICQQLISQQLVAHEINILQSVNKLLDGILDFNTANLASTQIAKYQGAFESNYNKLLQKDTELGTSLVSMTDKLAIGQMNVLESEFKAQYTRLDQENFYGSDPLKDVLSKITLFDKKPK